jgi:4-hydroxy-tetrahydrodipicolinate synthase
MFKGLLPAMVTPFDERLEVDLEATEAVVERFVAAGVDGILILGSTGEFPHLTSDERKSFAEEMVKIAAGRVPLLVGVGSSGTTEAAELAHHAEDAGADAVVVVSPFYWKVGEEALFRHFAAVADAVSLPVLIYNFPMLTGVNLSPSLVERMARECSNVSGIKDTVTEYSHVWNVLRGVKAERPDFRVFAGFEDLILPSMLAGGDGAICGLANVAPELFVSLVRAMQSGDLGEASELHRRVLSLMALGSLGDTPLGATKLAMNLLGVPISPAVRGPALPPSEEARGKVEAVLREANLTTARETS